METLQTNNPLTNGKIIGANVSYADYSAEAFKRGLLSVEPIPMQPGYYIQTLEYETRRNK